MYKHTAVTLFVITLLWGGGLASAQETRPKDTPEREGPARAPALDLTAQLAELRATMARLEAALDQDHKASGMNPASPDPDMGMDMRKRDMSSGGMSMGMKKKNAAEGPGMSGGGMKKMKGGMGKKGPMEMGMGMMGDMGASVDSSVHEVSALPGFPGASHIYHIGATGFFVDHAEHLELSADQLRTLNDVREKETLKQSTLTRQTEEREQELWVLTSADQPDARQIEAKIREIEKLRADKRLSFIRSVGRAASVLSNEQVSRLKGELSSEERKR